MIKKAVHGSMPEVSALIPEKDMITFSVLRDIISHECDYIASDGAGFIICSTVSRYPVWIWCAEGREKELCGTVLELLNADIPERRYLNVTKPMLDELTAQDSSFGYRNVVFMLAYDCPEPIAPKKHPEGFTRTATADDIPVLVEMDKLFYREITSQNPPPDETLAQEEAERAEKGLTYVWVTPEGEISAKCCYIPDEKQARISGVFTFGEHRRKGYAEQLVYQAACDILAGGKIPCLYTDAEYSASNACYTGIGFIRRGDLATVERTEK